MSPAPPPRPPAPPAAALGAPKGPPESCAGCGQPLRPAGIRCEFCGLAVEGRTPPPRVPAFRTCPHCGAEGLPLPTGRCPDCRELYSKPVSASLQAKATVIRALRQVKISGPTFAIGLLVTLGLTTFFVNWSYSKKGNTANHLRNIKQRLEIYAGENGGYPTDFVPVEQRGGPFPPDWKVDSWGTPIRYSTSGRRFDNPEVPGQATFEKCDLRSAGPNRKFDDDDDLSWQGQSD